MLSTDQYSLIRTAFYKGDRLRQAWLQGRTVLDNDRLSGGDYILPALIASNLEQEGIQDPLSLLLKGTSRHVWCKNQLIKQDLEPLLLQLNQHRIDHALVGEAGFSLLAYQSDRLLKRHEICLLIAPHTMDAVETICLELGWTVKTRQQLAKNGLDIYETVFATAEGHKIRLAASLYWDRDSYLTLTDLPKAALTLTEVGQAQTWILSPTYQLIYLIGRLRGYLPRPLVVWSVHLTALLTQYGETIHWETVTNYLDSSDAIFSLKRVTAGLKEQLAISAVAEFNQRIQAVRPSRWRTLKYLVSLRVQHLGHIASASQQAVQQQAAATRRRLSGRLSNI